MKQGTIAKETDITHESRADIGIRTFVLCTFAHLSNKAVKAWLEKLCQVQVSQGRGALGISKTPRWYWSSF